MKKIESRGWKTRMQALCLMLLCACAWFGVAGSAFAQDLPAAETAVAVVETAAAMTFDSGNVAAGTTFSHTFAAAGTFAFHCNIHSSMKGTITVTN